MDETTPSTPRASFTREEVDNAVAMADFMIVREAMGRTNPHDLNNIRGQIYIQPRLQRFAKQASTR